MTLHGGNYIRPLFKLYRKGFLDDDFAVIGTARREWTDDHYREVVLDSIRKLVPATIDPDEFTKPLLLPGP